MRPNPLVKRTVHGAGDLIEQQLSAARNSRYGVDSVQSPLSAARRRTLFGSGTGRLDVVRATSMSMPLRQSPNHRDFRLVPNRSLSSRSATLGSW